MHFSVRADITLEARDEAEALRVASEIAEAASETEPAIEAAANVVCADSRPELIYG